MLRGGLGAPSAAAGGVAGADDRDEGMPTAPLVSPPPPSPVPERGAAAPDGVPSAPEADVDFLSALPEGPKSAIALFLQARGYAALSSVNRAWRDTAVDDTSLWCALGRAHFGDAMEGPSQPAEVGAGGGAASDDAMEATGAVSEAASDPPAAGAIAASVGRWAWKDAYIRSRVKYGRVSIGTPGNARITWGDEPRYWSPSHPDTSSSFGHIALCRAVCWFDVSGRSPILSPGRYRVGWRLSGGGVDEPFTAHCQVRGFNGPFSWTASPTEDEDALRREVGMGMPPLLTPPPTSPPLLSGGGRQRRLHPHDRAERVAGERNLGLPDRRLARGALGLVARRQLPAL